MSSSQARSATSWDLVETDCTTEGLFRKLLVLLGGRRFSLSAAYRYSNTNSLEVWRETLFRDLAKGIEDLSGNFTKRNKRTDSTRGRKQGVQLEAEAIAWYRSGELFEDLLRGIEKDKTDETKRSKELDDVFLRLADSDQELYKRIRAKVPAEWNKEGTAAFIDAFGQDVIDVGVAIYFLDPVEKCCRSSIELAPILAYMVSRTFISGRWSPDLRKKWSVYVADSVAYFASHYENPDTPEFRKKLAEACKVATGEKAKAGPRTTKWLILADYLPKPSELLAIIHQLEKEKHATSSSSLSLAVRHRLSSRQQLIYGFQV